MPRPNSILLLMLVASGCGIDGQDDAHSPAHADAIDASLALETKRCSQDEMTLYGLAVEVNVELCGLEAAVSSCEAYVANLRQVYVELDALEDFNDSYVQFVADGIEQFESAIQLQHCPHSQANPS